MDPELILQAFNVMTGVAGIVAIYAASKSRGVTRAILAVLGTAIIVCAILLLPSRLLQSAAQSRRPAQEQASVADDDSANEAFTVVEGEKSGHTVIITEDRDVVDLLTELLRKGGSERDGEPETGTNADEEAEPTPGRDPFRAQEVTPTPTPEATPEATPEPTPTPAPTPTPVPAPKRERTLPDESADGPALCTNFKLLHGSSGGPEPEGCFAVGCAQGYALPMSFTAGSWQACASYTRLERVGDCYFVSDRDGTERSMRFVENNWKQSDCTSL